MSLGGFPAVLSTRCAGSIAWFWILQASHPEQSNGNEEWARTPEERRGFACGFDRKDHPADPLLGLFLDRSVRACRSAYRTDHKLAPGGRSRRSDGDHRRPAHWYARLRRSAWRGFATGCPSHHCPSAGLFSLGSRGASETRIAAHSTDRNARAGARLSESLDVARFSRTLRAEALCQIALCGTSESVTNGSPRLSRPSV